MAFCLSYLSVVAVNLWIMSKSEFHFQDCITIWGDINNIKHINLSTALNNQIKITNLFMCLYYFRD